MEQMALALAVIARQVAIIEMTSALPDAPVVAPRGRRRWSARRLGRRRYP